MRPTGLDPSAEDLVRSVAHDLRSPLTSLHGFVRLLERDYGTQLEDGGRSYLNQIQATVTRMQSLVEELLTFGPPRGTLGRRRHIDSHEICLQLAADLKPVLDERGIHLILPTVPPPVYSARTQFLQVLSNLVCNAIQHMNSTGSPWIRVDLRRAAGGVELCIEDNGRGIPPSLQAQILKPHATSANGDLGPSRLGLTIVKRIVEAHGGWIMVSSPPGRGATFRAFFPDPV